MDLWAVKSHQNCDDGNDAADATAGGGTIRVTGPIVMIDTVFSHAAC
jgi:hypothetical protein